MTITEGLAEIKTIDARLAKKHESVQRHLVRNAGFADPLENDGGSKEFVRRERQAINDLETRVVKIRTAIQESNLRCTVVVAEETRSVAEWLNWRREVSANQKYFLAMLAKVIEQARTAATKAGGSVKEDGAQVKAGDIVVAISEVDLAGEIEHIETVLGELDGRLSLFNATTSIEV